MSDPSVTYHVTLDNGQLVKAHAANPLFPNQRVDLTQDEIDEINKTHSNELTTGAYDSLRVKYRKYYLK